MSAIDSKRIIAIDVMGGDQGPESVIAGGEIAAKQCSDCHFLLYGRESTVKKMLEHTPNLKRISTVINVEDVVAVDEKPSAVIRRGRNTSMGQAIQSVRAGAAQAAVSSGNTGALMAMSKILLGMLPAIERPAICGLMPQKQGSSVMLDIGANVAASAENLFDFAIMGHAYARVLLKKDDPSVGLLNVGSEDIKGHDTVRQAAALIKESELPINFIGHVEGNDICNGEVDVIVTDGFTGNIALKTLEGTAQMYTGRLKAAFNKGILNRIAKLTSYSALNSLKTQMDPRNYNGAMFLGINGIIIKSHGGSDAQGNANAILMALALAKEKVNDQIIQEMIDSGHVPPDEFTVPLALPEKAVS